ncbi:DUF5719 family protein [Arthrobacter sp. I2-34]|uniref:DUF5719 family protein n=1 Tax=Arthrobacter hankyongi TaxID=2904801 RepID=A0ABS9L1L8_9MICC|nr:DUF5719 family protein [Arthrobacter hankyongi]MCG2620592.1 DUF5719 family protein [Arthrobacter hankyongi]
MTDKPAQPQPESGAAGRAAAAPGIGGSGAAPASEGAGSGAAGHGPAAVSGRRAHRKDSGRSGLRWRKARPAAQPPADTGSVTPAPAASPGAAAGEPTGARPSNVDEAEASAGSSSAAAKPSTTGEPSTTAASGRTEGTAPVPLATPSGSTAAGSQPAASGAGSAKPGHHGGTAPASADTAAGKPAARKPTARKPKERKPAARNPDGSKPAVRPADGRRSAWGIAAGVGLLAVAGAAAAAGSVWDIEGAAAEVPAVSAAVAAGNFTGVCPEPLRLLDSTADETDPQFSPVSESARSRARAVVFSDLGGVLPGSRLAELGARNPLVTIAKSSGDSSTAVRGSSDDGQTKLLAGVVSGQALTEPTVLSVEPIGGQQALAGAAMTYQAGDGDLRGLAAANCTAPANDFWLLGAATTVGATAVLDLHNPTQTPSTINLELVGAGGRIQAAGTRGLLLAPGESRAIVLGGLAAKQESLAVHVRTSGGPVSGTIQQSFLRGLAPGGVELLTPTADAAVEQVVTGVQIQGGKPAGSRAQTGGGSAKPALAVAVPGRQDARLQIQVFGKDGEARLPGGGALTAAAGTVTEVPLDALPAGTYSIRIASDVSVVAAARVSRTAGKDTPPDFAWSPAAGRLGSEHLAVVPGGTASRLVFGAPAGDATVKLVPVDRDGKPGKEQVIHVPGGSTVAVDPKAGGADPAAVVVSASGEPVYGAQVLTGADRADVSVLPVPPGVQGRQSVPVYLGY